MDGARIRARFAGERDLALAHTTALFSRLKKLEPLARYLPARDEPAREAAPMIDQLKRMVAQTGGVWCEDEPEA